MLKAEVTAALGKAGVRGACPECRVKHADIKLLQEIAGHASATMTLDRYGHLMTDRVSEAADLFEPFGEARRRSVVDGGR
jgi:integrase